MKMSCFFLAFVLLLSLFGCAAQENNLEGNNMFTDEFFSDIVEIRDSRCGQVSGEQMEPVILYLKGLTLTETDEHLMATNENGEQLYGLDLITFIKSNGTEITFLRNHAALSSLDACRYVIEGENLNSGLEEAFSQALNHSGE